MVVGYIKQIHNYLILSFDMPILQHLSLRHPTLLKLQLTWLNLWLPTIWLSSDDPVVVLKFELYT